MCGPSGSCDPRDSMDEFPDFVKNMAKELGIPLRKWVKCDLCGDWMCEDTEDWSIEDEKEEYRRNFPDDPDMKMPTYRICDDCYYGVGLR